MKEIQLKIEYREDGEEEIILRISKEHQALADTIRKLLEEKKMVGTCGREKILFEWSGVYYFEYVEGKVFAYLKDKVCSIPWSLDKLEQTLPELQFFRCSKSMILNIQYVEQFQSTMGNRIIATLSNGEDVVVSRYYAKQLRTLLRDE